MSVAMGLADIALATDSMGEGRVPAACNGLFAYRPTPGAIGAIGATAQPSSPGLQGLVVMAKDSRTLIKSAEALGVTGKWRSSGG